MVAFGCIASRCPEAWIGEASPPERSAEAGCNLSCIAGLRKQAVCAGQVACESPRFLEHVRVDGDHAGGEHEAQHPQRLERIDVERIDVDHEHTWGEQSKLGYAELSHDDRCWVRHGRKRRAQELDRKSTRLNS